MRQITHRLLIEPAEEGGFVAAFPDLPGCHTQGDTLTEVIARAQDVYDGYLSVLARTRCSTPTKPRWSKCAHRPAEIQDWIHTPLNPHLTLEKFGFQIHGSGVWHWFAQHGRKRKLISIPVNGNMLKGKIVRAIYNHADLTHDQIAHSLRKSDFGENIRPFPAS